jgi:DNA-binding SARP family transcriptional activator
MIQLKTLGQLELDRGDGSDFSALLTQPKRLALLVYLALPALGTKHRRDTLLGLFWPELDQQRARTALRNSLSHIRHVLGHDIVKRRGDEEVGLDPDMLSCDATAFENAVREGAWDTALNLYRGHFLEGFFISNAIGFEHWLEDERTRLREMAAGAAWSLAHQHIELGRPVDAERTAQRALSLVVTDESEVRKFINALAAAGDRASAVRFYEKFIQRLGDEYEIEPSPETAALVETIRNNVVSIRPGRDEVSVASTDSPGTVSEAPMAEELSGPPAGMLRKWVLRTGAAAAVAIVVAVIALLVALPRGGDLGLDPNYVVVSVFRNATGDPSLDLLGERVGHWITRGLQQAEIPVTPWTHAVQSWEHVQLEMDSNRIRDPVLGLAEETGAGIVVSGAVYLIQGDSLEVQTEVTDVARGRRLGSIDPFREPREFESEMIGQAQQRVMSLLAVRFDEALSDVLIAAGGPPTFEAYQAFRDAAARAFSGDFEGAEPRIRRAAELDTTWAQPLIRLAVWLRVLDRLSERDSVLRVLERFDGRLSAYDDAELRWYRAAIAGDQEQAIANLRIAAELAPRSPAVYNLALELRRNNRPRESVEVLRTLDPARGWAREVRAHWQVLSKSLNMLGLYEEEIETAVRAYEMFPDSYEYFHAVQARALAAMGRVDELNEMLDGLVNSTSNLPDVRYALARSPEVLRAKGHVEPAREVAERAVDWLEAREINDERTLEPRMNYGLVLFLSGRFDDAQRVFDMLVEEFPEANIGDTRNPPRNIPGPRLARGFVAAMHGDTTRAMSEIEWFQTVDTAGLSSGEKNQLVHDCGVIHGALGDRERAVEMIREAGWRATLFRESVLYDPLREYAPFVEFMRPKG